jgi:hypothetical protein
LGHAARLFIYSRKKRFYFGLAISGHSSPLFCIDDLKACKATTAGGMNQIANNHQGQPVPCQLSIRVDPEKRTRQQSANQHVSISCAQQSATYFIDTILEHRNGFLTYVIAVCFVSG